MCHVLFYVLCSVYNVKNAIKDLVFSIFVEKRSEIAYLLKHFLESRRFRLGICSLCNLHSALLAVHQVPRATYSVLGALD